MGRLPVGSVHASLISDTSSSQITRDVIISRSHTAPLKICLRISSQNLCRAPSSVNFEPSFSAHSIEKYPEVSNIILPSKAEQYVNT
jgi:hypothetical protein